MAHPAYRWKHYQQALKRWRRELPPCSICGQATTPSTVSVDHIQGVSSFPEGTPARVISHPSNLRPTHRTCNLQRSRSQQARTGSDRPKPEHHHGYR
jgi:hypothetical protein